MNENVKIFFGLIGGLALFLYGMNSMSDALQKAAGEGMKKILSFLTRNAVMGALAGALVTAVLQSSSATTVMVIGFVSAGLMSLPQAISVIFGANIGTTMTAQLMAFKISNYIYPIIFIGFLLNFISKKEKIKNIGMVIFSFGLLFEGIEIMGSVMKPLASSPFFVDMMGKVSHIPVLGVLLGAGMTLVVQSSSATIAVLQNFASQAGPDGVTSVIGLTGAIPILLGDNIGTTITALLASIGQSKNAKRTALAHSVFNITGSIVFLFLIPLLAAFVRFISPKGPELYVISRQIANAHTTFNIVCTLIWLPLIPVMVKIVTCLVRGQDQQERQTFEPQFLENRVLTQPAAALYLVSEEIQRVSDFTRQMMDSMKLAFVGKEPVAAYQNFKEMHFAVKKLQEQIGSYIVKMFASGTLTEQQSEQAAGLLYINNNIDRIADRCEEIGTVAEFSQEHGGVFSAEALHELETGIGTLKNLFVTAMQALENGDKDIVAKVSKDKNKIRKLQKQNNKAHMARIKKNTCSSDLTMQYSNMLYNIDRIADNCVSISEEAMDNISFQKLYQNNAEQDQLKTGGTAE